MTLEDALLKALEGGGPGNPRQIGARLTPRVREALNNLADAGKIERRQGQGNEYIYSLKSADPLPHITRRV